MNMAEIMKNVKGLRDAGFVVSDISEKEKKVETMWRDYTTRKEDTIKTNRINPYLDKMYAENGWKVIRINDEISHADMKFLKNNVDALKGQNIHIDDLQKNYGDVALVKDGKIKFVEEKAAITAWNYDLRTYSIEYSSDNNKGGLGWFMNSESKTNSYAFIYPQATDKELTDITKLDVLIVDAKKLRHYMENHGAPIFPEDVERLRHSMDSVEERNGRKIYRNDYGLKVVQSMDKDEKPICICAKRGALEKMAEYTFVYEKDALNKEMPQNKEEYKPSVLQISDFKDEDVNPSNEGKSQQKINYTEKVTTKQNHHNQNYDR